MSVKSKAFGRSTSANALDATFKNRDFPVDKIHEYADTEDKENCYLSIRDPVPMFAFDMKSAIFTYLLINYLYTFVLGFFWYQNREHAWGTQFFFGDFLCKSVGMTLAFQRETLSPEISIVLANFLMFSGSILTLFGMGRFLKIKIPVVPPVLYTLLFTGLYAWFALVHTDVRVRIMLFSGMLTPVVGYMAFLVLTAKEKVQKGYAFHAGICFTLFALVSVARFACALTGDAISGYYNTPITDSFLTILCQILSIYLAYAIYLMVGGRLSHVWE